MDFDKDYLTKVTSGEIAPPAFYTINETGDGLREKTEAEIMATATDNPTGWGEVTSWIKGKIAGYKQTLADTDYIVAKLQETALLGTTEETETLKARYAGEITARKEARTRINELEAKLTEIEENPPVFPELPEAKPEVLPEL